MNATGFKDAAKLNDARMLAESFSKKGKAPKGAKSKDHYHKEMVYPGSNKPKYYGAYGQSPTATMRSTRLQHPRQATSQYSPIWDISSDAPGVLGSKGVDFLRRVEVAKENNPPPEPQKPITRHAIVPPAAQFDVKPTPPPPQAEVPETTPQPAKPSIMDMFNLEMQMELLALNSTPVESPGTDAGRAAHAFSNQLELVMATEASNNCEAVETSSDTAGCKCSRVLQPVKHGLAHSRFATAQSQPISSDGKFTFNPAVKLHDATCPLRISEANGSKFANFTFRPEAETFVSRGPD